jgi:hypothetical protein
VACWRSSWPCWCWPYGVSWPPTERLAAESAGDAEALNLAGRQAMLAERLSAQAVSVRSGEDSALPLEDTLRQMMNDAVRLYELRGVWGGNEDDPEPLDGAALSACGRRAVAADGARARRSRGSSLS